MIRVLHLDPKPLYFQRGKTLCNTGKQRLWLRYGNELVVIHPGACRFVPFLEDAS